MIEAWQLKQLQSLSLKAKVARSERKITEWYHAWEGDVYVSFSGGKDSTVLLHLVRSLFPKVPAAFLDTGLEYPEIRNFVKSINNVTWLKPRMNFKEVIEKYGYPVVSKQVSMGLDRYRNTKSEEQRQLRLNGGINPTSGRKQNRTISQKWHYLINCPFKFSDRCCDVMKKAPLKKYAKENNRKPFIGSTASESQIRKIEYLKSGCNVFKSAAPHSLPLSIWSDTDIWAYLREHQVPYSEIYDMGEKRTGCMFCMFGVHLESEPNRFQRMKKSHPAQWNYCINKLGLKEILDYIGVPYE